jgi:hypothetical protein
MGTSLSIMEITSFIDTEKGIQAFETSFQDHVRNGRGFWPVVQAGGTTQVIRFAPRQGDARWTPSTGLIDFIPLHAVSPVDLPRLRPL